MKPDGTSSFSAADEKLVSPEGNHVSEPDVKTGPAIKKYRHSDGTIWSYIFVHNSKVKKLEMLLEEDGRTYFVHKTVRYFRKQGKQKVQHQEVPTVSGLVFFQGYPKEIQSYLDQYFPNARLCKTVARARWQRSPMRRCNPSCVSQRHHLIASVSCYIHTIIMLATASSSVSPLVRWQDWKVTSSVSTETAAW